MGGRKSKRKGTAGEREFANLVGGVRVPLSGAAGGEFSGDVIWPGVGKGEVKRRKKEFVKFYKWLEGKDFLAIRDDRQEWLVIFRLGFALEKIHGLSSCLGERKD